MKSYYAGIENVSSNLAYDNSRYHIANIQIVFSVRGDEFEDIANALNDLINDIEELCKQSRKSDEDLPTRLEVSG